MAKVIPQLILTNFAIDAIETICLVLLFLKEEKPLRGFMGRADWRLNGEISRHLQANHLKGDLKETILIPSLHRLKAQNLLILGLGDPKNHTKKTFQETLDHLTGVIGKARIHSFVLALNGILPEMDQLQWLGDWLCQRPEVTSAQSTLPKSWTVMVENEDLEGLKKTLQKTFAKKLTLRIEARPEDESTRRAFTAR